MKNIKSKLIVLVFAIPVLLISCEDNGYDDYGREGTPSQEMNGEWEIDIIDEASGDVLVSHVHHETYDNNLGNGTMMIDDHQEGWYLKGTLNVDVNNLIFTANNADNLNDEGTTFTITEGKIMKLAALSTSGSPVDSIYFKATFSYDPETVLIYSGKKITGFEED